MRIVEEEFLYHIKGQAIVLLPAYQMVEEAWQGKDNFHPSGEFLWFKNPCPWKDHLYEKESEQGQEGVIKFVFYQDERKLVRVQTVAPKGNHFAQRVTLNKAWHGLRKQDFVGMDIDSDNLSFLKDIEFVHHSGFIGGAWTLESAIKMAEMSMEEHKKAKELAAAEEEAKKQEQLQQEQQQQNQQE